MKTTDYCNTTLHTLPHVTLLMKERKEIVDSLNSKSPQRIHKTFDYYKSNKWLEERKLLKGRLLSKLQKVAPNFIFEQGLSKTAYNA